VAAVATLLADTSALARLRHPEVAAVLSPLIEAGLVGTCAVIELEIGRSAASPAHYATVAADRAAGYELLATDDWIATRALEVQAALARTGEHRGVPIPDLLVAATAERHRVEVLHYDRDFERIAAVTRQPVRWVAEAGSIP
jgi:hypothetical protein